MARLKEKMRPKIAINGYGRIGQALVRTWASRPDINEKLQLVAINELCDPATLAYLTRYDSIYGHFPVPVSEAFDQQQPQLIINNRPINLLNEPEANQLPWAELDIDLVLESSGSFTSRAKAEEHLAAGAGKLMFSQPAEADVDATLVYGVNHTSLMPNMQIVSAASCTTNCLVPLLHLLDEHLGIDFATCTTLHSVMNDQPVSDQLASGHKNLRLARSALASLIPVETGLAKGVARLMPHLEGKLACSHLRLPTLQVSAMDLTLQLKTASNAAAINQLIEAASQSQLKGVLGYCSEPLVSVDFTQNPLSSLVDASQTQMAGDKLVKLLCWFDNEWAYANRMLELASYWLRQ